MDDEQAAKAATDWLIALQEDPEDAALRARFLAWRNAAPAHEAAWQEAAAVYGLIGQAPPRYAGRWAAPRPLRRRLVRSALAATGFALVACLAVVILSPGLVTRLRADEATATAETRVLRLADGSTVRLGPYSALDIAFAAGERRVRLLRGEAFFEVRPDATRPFRVETGAIETTVVGTAFDVRRGAEGAEIAVREGIVGVAEAMVQPPVAERLVAGDWLRVTWGGQVTRGRTGSDQVAAWLQGHLIVRDRTVAEVVDDLRRYYPGIIVLTDATLAARRLTGAYNLADPAAALSAVAQAHGAVVHRLSPWLMVIAGN
ncbi:MAG: FecR family protein [Ferrovibrionaceae bacterium]